MNQIVKYGFLSVIIIVLVILFLSTFQANLGNITKNNVNKTKVAIILPHPDDEVIGMGGNIQILTENGCQIYCVLMTSGNDVSPGLRPVKNYYNVSIPPDADKAETKKLIREDSFKRVMNILEVPYEMKGITDGYLSTDTAFKTMENLYLEGNFTEFYTVTADGSPDHLSCYRAMKKMKEKYPNLKYRQFPIYYYHKDRKNPITLSSDYKDIDVSKYKSKKMEAFKIYYNINTLIPEFYPYSDGLIQSSPERIYYIN